MPNSVVKELIDKTFKELSTPAQPIQRSRISHTPNGYIHLVPWSNASLLRLLVKKCTNTLPKSEYRLKAQLDDAARSVIANIEEGYARPTTSEYLTFLGYSQASLIEVKGDIQRSRQDGWLVSEPGSSLMGVGVDLKAWHEALKKSVISQPTQPLQDPTKPQHVYTAVANATHPPSFIFLYPPVDNLEASLLTYEIFIELINKTDWHLRTLVSSLENKLNQDQKYYKVEQSRIKSTIRMR